MPQKSQNHLILIGTALTLLSIPIMLFSALISSLLLVIGLITFIAGRLTTPGG